MIYLHRKHNHGKRRIHVFNLASHAKMHVITITSVLFQFEQFNVLSSAMNTFEQNANLIFLLFYILYSDLFGEKFQRSPFKMNRWAIQTYFLIAGLGNNLNVSNVMILFTCNFHLYCCIVWECHCALTPLVQSF